MSANKAVFLTYLVAALLLACPLTSLGSELGETSLHVQRSTLPLPSHGDETVTERLRGIQTELFALDALLTHPVDELQRRQLKQRVQRVHHTLSLVLQQLPPAPPHQTAEAIQANPPAPAVDPESFNTLLIELETAAYEDERAQALELALSERSITSQQARQVLKRLPFEQERLDAATGLAHKLLDPQNASKLLSTLHFSTSRKALKRAIAEATSR